MLEIMYEIPSKKNVEKVIISKEVVVNQAEPKVIYRKNPLKYFALSKSFHTKTAGYFDEFSMTNSRQIYHPKRVEGPHASNFINRINLCK